MSKQKLTKRTVEQQQPGTKDSRIWDTQVGGFHCKITPAGKRVYHLYYRTREGQERRPRIGVHGDITCDQARAIARQWRAEIAQGGDPSLTKKEARLAPSMTELCDRFLTEHAEIRKKPASLRDDRRMIARFIKPEMGAMKVSAVTTAEVSRMHHRLHETPYQANQVRALLSKMFNLAEAWGLRLQGTNPTKYVEKYPEEKRERHLDGVQIARLGEALNKAESEATEAPQVVAALKLLLLTGCRKSEVLKLRWEEIDWEKGVLELSDTKTGRQERSVGEPVLELLRLLPWKAETGCVVPGADPSKPWVNLSKPWGRIRAAADLEDVRIHDLRHTHASAAAELGMSLPMIGALLGHTQAATTQRYAHLANDPVREAADRVSGNLADQLNGAAPPA
jgi:integrase